MRSMANLVPTLLAPPRRRIPPSHRLPAPAVVAGPVPPVRSPACLGPVGRTSSTWSSNVRACRRHAEAALCRRRDRGDCRAIGAFARFPNASLKHDEVRCDRVLIDTLGVVPANA